MDKGLLTGELVLCGENTIEIGGQTLRPDAAKGYVEFLISHSFPVVTAHGFSLHAGTIANSSASMLHTVLNLGHLMRFYDKENIPRDRILGAIVGLEYLRADGTAINGGQTPAPKRKQDSPYLRVVASLFKNAEGADRILGSHQSGRKTWTVSMEVDYTMGESGMVVEGDVPEFADTTPPDIRAAGWSYCPWAQCPESLLACFEKGSVTRPWKKMRPAVLMNGVNGRVQYSGVGIVDKGAEAEAEIIRMAASAAKEVGDGSSELENGGWKLEWGPEALGHLEGMQKNLKEFSEIVLTRSGGCVGGVEVGK